jgi:hypothetical protein
LLRSLFNGNAFNEFAGTAVTYQLSADWGYGSPFPSVDADYWSLRDVGVVRKHGDGWYKVRCVTVRATCSWVFSNGTQNAAVVELSVSQDTSVQVTIQHSTFETSYRFELAGPFASAALATAATANFSWLPLSSEELVHDFTCNQSCVNGCCAAEAQCACYPGWAGTAR